MSRTAARLAAAVALGALLAAGAARAAEPSPADAQRGAALMREQMALMTPDLVEPAR